MITEIEIDGIIRKVIYHQNQGPASPRAFKWP
jgi:hypothetical protein